MSISGGLHKAVERIIEVGGTALQVFTRNQRQWKIPVLNDSDVEIFARIRTDWGKYPVVAHDSYLINLASPDKEKSARSIRTFAMELDRCQKLQIPWLVTHPGSHLGQGVLDGTRTYTANLDRCIEMAETDSVMVLLETTAGQGTNLGSTFEELAEIISLSNYPGRLGICFDTCHAFSAGYDLRTAESYGEVMDHFDATVGIEKIKVFHMNDSKTPLGSHKDRHEHIGLGSLGESSFINILTDSRLSSVPMILETPKETDLKDDVHNLNKLRELAGETK